MLFYHVKHVLVKSSVLPVADNQDDDHSNISEEENDSDSDSEDEESDEEDEESDKDKRWWLNTKCKHIYIIDNLIEDMCVVCYNVAIHHVLVTTL